MWALEVSAMLRCVCERSGAGVAGKRRFGGRVGRGGARGTGLACSGLAAIIRIWRSRFLTCSETNLVQLLLHQLLRRKSATAVRRQVYNLQPPRCSAHLQARLQRQAAGGQRDVHAAPRRPSCGNFRICIGL